MKAPVRPPVPSHSEFLESFARLFGGEGAAPIAADLVGALEGVCHEPVTAAEVERAAGAMAAGESTGLA